ncbi:hypothetical protein TNCV_4389791 [Trichonephila clavipes]|nr:hypothetical protein TNCV_4389791 [Trichonephila clavipes]
MKNILEESDDEYIDFDDEIDDPDFQDPALNLRYSSDSDEVASVASKNAMTEAADEVKKLKNTSDVAECGVSVDGTWQRQGTFIVKGCVAVLSIDTGKVLDLEVMSKWCRNCNTSRVQEK